MASTVMIGYQVIIYVLCFTVRDVMITLYTAAILTPHARNCHSLYLVHGSLLDPLQLDLFW